MFNLDPSKDYSEYKIRSCDNSFIYCDGKCSICEKNNTYITNKTSINYIYTPDISTTTNINYNNSTILLGIDKNLYCQVIGPWSYYKNINGWVSL